MDTKWHKVRFTEWGTYRVNQYPVSLNLYAELLDHFMLQNLQLYNLLFVQLGPIPSTSTKVQFRPNQNTKVTFKRSHAPPPKTSLVVPCRQEA